MRRSLRPLLLGLALALAAPRPASAGSPTSSDFRRYYESAVRLYKSMDFERSLEQLKLARQQPHGADDDVAATLYEGILRFELGDEAGSAEAFRSALSLNLEARLPAKVSPRIEILLEKERSALRQKFQPAAPSPPAATAATAAPVPVPVPAAPPANPPLAPAVAPAASAAADVVAASDAPRKRRTWAVAPTVVGAVALTLGGVFLYFTDSYYSDLKGASLTRQQADNYRDAGKTFQTAGWTLASVGFAAVVAGAVLLAVPVSEPPPVAVSPAVGPNTVGLSIGGRLP